MTKKHRTWRIQARLNRATYPLVFFGWSGKRERAAIKAHYGPACRMLGTPEVQEKIRQQIRDVLVRGCSHPLVCGPIDEPINMGPGRLIHRNLPDAN